MSTESWFLKGYAQDAIEKLGVLCKPWIG